MKIALYSDENGDWERLYVNGELRYDNHSIPEYVWMELLEELGVEITEEYVTTEWFEQNTGKFL